MRLRDRYKESLLGYCKENNLDYEKLKKFPCCGNDKVLFIQYYDPKCIDASKGLADDKPAEIVLSLTVREDGSIDFIKGENLRKYLDEKI